MAQSIPEMYGSLVFNDKVMRSKLPKDMYKALKKTIENGTHLELDVANSVAVAMKEWATENGATHYTHWFQPMTNVTAEKHDSFINNAGGGIYYHSFSDNDAAAQNLSGAYGGYLSYGYNKWHLITNYEKVKKITQLPKDQNAALWVTKLTYGHVSLKKNTWDTWLSYVDADPNFIYGSTGSWRNYNLLDNVKSWEIGADYTVAKNVVFSLFQTFNSKLKDDYYGNSSPGEETRAQLWYFF